MKASDGLEEIRSRAAAQEVLLDHLGEGLVAPLSSAESLVCLKVDGDGLGSHA